MHNLYSGRETEPERKEGGGVAVRLFARAHKRRDRNLEPRGARAGAKDVPGGGGLGGLLGLRERPSPPDPPPKSPARPERNRAKRALGERSARQERRRLHEPRALSGLTKGIQGSTKSEELTKGPE